MCYRTSNFVETLLKIQLFSCRHLQFESKNWTWQQEMVPERYFGATAHFARKVSEELDDYFANRWIGSRWTIELVPRSCDLIPSDFFLVGYLKHNTCTVVIKGIRPLLNNWKSKFAIKRATFQFVFWNSVCPEANWTFQISLRQFKLYENMTYLHGCLGCHGFLGHSVHVGVYGCRNIKIRA